MLVADILHADRQLKTSLRDLAQTVRATTVESFVSAVLERGPAILRSLHEMPEDTTMDVERWLDQRLTPRAALHAPPPASPESPRTNKLTRKELQILELLAHGCSNEAMARQLFVSESTVRTHLRSINYKLRARSRTQAVAIARSLKLVA